MHLSDDGKHLSLYLNMGKPNDLPKDLAAWSNLPYSSMTRRVASIAMQLVRILTEVFSINRVPDANLSSHIPNLSYWGNVGRFSTSNCKWGLEKFISLEDFKDASNGYLTKNKCCIEGKLEIVGSSRKG